MENTIRLADDYDEMKVLIERIAMTFQIMAENFETLAEIGARNASDEVLFGFFDKYKDAGLIEFASGTLPHVERISRRQYEAMMFFVGIKAAALTEEDIGYTCWLYDCTKIMRNASMTIEHYRISCAVYDDQDMTWFLKEEASNYRRCCEEIRALAR